MDHKGLTSNAQSFDQQYVTTNIAVGAPEYSEELIERLRKQLLDTNAEDVDNYSYAILTAMFIGAHRGDIVPKMFETAIKAGRNSQEIEDIFYKMRETVMATWAFVGIPWCVPACLGIVAVMQRNGLEHLGTRAVRSSLDVEQLLAEGRKVNANTYAKVNNNEVRELLSVGFPEFRLGLSAIVWGYGVGGAGKSGFLTPAQVELCIATSIIASGASRQSRSHVKASLGMGNSFAMVQKVVEIITEFTSWNGTPLPHSIDVEQLATEVLKT